MEQDRYREGEAPAGLAGGEGEAGCGGTQAGIPGIGELHRASNTFGNGIEGGSIDKGNRTATEQVSNG